MHMADALLSPAVGGSLWAVSAATIGWCSKKVKDQLDERKVPLMGVLGAFLFAAQMINFSIPGTGSSGHLGGGLLLAVLLGPPAAFLTIASVLVVQALFFADGGLLALGCNIFNLGFFPAFVAYPLIYCKIAGQRPSPLRLTVATILAAVVGLQLGALGVVVETLASGISSLPFSTFVLFMQPIHLAIGIIEGVVTAAIISFVYRARPDLLDRSVPAAARQPLRKLLLVFLSGALLTGGVLSWFASKDPDGLEWALARASGKEELQGPGQGVHAALADLQGRIAILPDYAFPKDDAGSASLAGGQVAMEANVESRLGSSVAGIVGGLITLLLAFLIGFLLKRSVHPAPARSDGSPPDGFPVRRLSCVQCSPSAPRSSSWV